jgi:hypothetical protein
MDRAKLGVATAVTLHDLYLTIESTLVARIEEALEFDNFDEDFLSRSFCEILKKQSPFEFLTFDGNVAETVVNFKKQTGDVETDFGDIGVTVRFTTKAGQTVIGCGFLEAKRRYDQRRNYKKLDWKQLETIEGNAPHAMLLLYDFADVRFNEDVSGDESRANRPRSRAVVVPITLARAINKRTIALYQSCTPLTHQVCYRYLQGLDLEIVKDEAGISDFFKRPGLKPKYALNVRVNHRERGTTLPNLGSPPVIPKDGVREVVAHVAHAAVRPTEQDEVVAQYRRRIPYSAADLPEKHKPKALPQRRIARR